MNITLIGMPGAGKSIVGREIAIQLYFRFIDTDEIIRQQTGLTLGETLERLGDVQFLQLEEQAVVQLAEFDNCVVSPGGSVIYSEKAMDFLKHRSLVVFLNVPFEIILKRIEPQRGIVSLREKNMKDLFDERLPLYEKYSNRTVCGNRSIPLVVEEIIKFAGVKASKPPEIP